MPVLIRRPWKKERARVSLVVFVLVAAVFAVSACGNGRAASMEEMLLRLQDVPAGATIGDDGACDQGFALEGASDTFAAWVLGHRDTRYCARQLQHQGDDGRWVFVTSAVIELQDAAEAAASEEVAEEFLGYWGYPEAVAVEPRFEGGKGRLAWRLVGGGPEHEGVGLSWTMGRYRHYIVVAGLADEAAEPLAGELAVRQQERFEHPTALADADLDDSQAGLARADGLPVYWVGPEWTPSGGAAAELARSEVASGSGIGPGYRARLEYEVPDSPLGAFDIGTWSQEGWEAMLAGQLGPVVIPGCAPPREVVLADRRIEIHGMGRAPDCFASASAYVFLEEVVVSILFPHCFVCQPRPSAYSTPGYLEAVARGLRRYEG